VTRSIAIATFLSALLGLAMIGGALYWQLDRTAGPTDPADRSFTTEELDRYDGVDGHQCLVAVDGDVYLIEGFALWSMGRHTPSGGRARCGLDLSDVIDESPHGKSKLRLLKKVGSLKGEEARSSAR
jgi:predicted heme/steroid binding protein